MTHRFQITDILSDDIIVSKTSREKEFLVTLYGIDEDHKRIVCHVLRFCPYFYLKVPNSWSSDESWDFAEYVCKEYNKDFDKKSCEMKTMSEFYGFHWKEEQSKIQRYNFLRLGFKTHQAMKKASQCFRDYHGEKTLPPEKQNYEYKPEYEDWFNPDIMKTTAKCDSNLYESTLHPVVRFIHE